MDSGTFKILQQRRLDLISPPSPGSLTVGLLFALSRRRYGTMALRLRRGLHHRRGGRTIGMGTMCSSSEKILLRDVSQLLLGYPRAVSCQ